MKRHLALAACCLALAACTDQRDPVTPITPGEPSLSAAGIVHTSKVGAPPTLPAYDPADIDPGHYNVIVRKEANARAVTAQIRNAHGLTTSHEWDEPWIKGFSARMTDKQRDQLKRHPHVAFVNQVVRGRIGGTLTYPYNWGLDRIDQRYLPMDDAYTYTDSAPNVNVYVLDTGIRRTHSDFGGRALFGYDAVTTGGTANDCHGHGTFVAAIIGGTEYGVAKRARLYAVRTADCTGHVATNDAISAVNWVTNNHRKPAVANISWYYQNEVPEVDQAIYASIQAGVTYVVLAGNDGVDACNDYPRPHAGHHHRGRHRPQRRTAHLVQLGRVPEPVRAGGRHRVGVDHGRLRLQGGQRDVVRRAARGGDRGQLRGAQPHGDAGHGQERRHQQRDDRRGDEPRHRLAQPALVLPLLSRPVTP